jgi:hypothetical protein
MGNTENPLRQNLILISATEDGQPRVDVMDVVKAKNFTGCLRARLATLTVSVTTGSLQTTSLTVMACTATTLPAWYVPSGNGRGYQDEVRDSRGEIVSSVTALRNDFATERGYLNNPAFDDGL